MLIPGPSRKERASRPQPRRAEQAVTGGVEAAISAARAKGKTALVVWFHFLGGKGSDWEQSLKTKMGNQLPWVEWYFPDAPQRPITNYGGQLARGWFDMLDGQVTEGMQTPGLDESVAAIHSLLRQAEGLGFPASRIMLGGMSQGGVLALKAGLTYERPLAGVAAFSAWVPPGLTAAMCKTSVPLLIGYGDKDEVVPMEICRRSAALLKSAGCNVAEKQYPGLDHSWTRSEREDMQKFMAYVLPNVQGSRSKQAEATIPLWPCGHSVAIPAGNRGTPLRLR